MCLGERAGGAKLGKVGAGGSWGCRERKQVGLTNYTNSRGSDERLHTRGQREVRAGGQILEPSSRNELKDMREGCRVGSP